MAGTNALAHLAGSWTPDQLRMNIAQLQFTKPFMPPFSGSAEEVEALVQLILWERAGAPASWQAPAGDLAQIARWLDAAAPGQEAPR